MVNRRNLETRSRFMKSRDKALVTRHNIHCPPAYPFVLNELDNDGDHKTDYSTEGRNIVKRSS